MTEEQVNQAAKVIFDSAWAFWSLVLSDMKYAEIFTHMNDPQVGDYAFENTNPFVPDKNKVGKILEMPAHGMYIIERLDGTTMEWSNAKMIKVPDEAIRDMVRR
jgi:hypothetical protein